MSKDKFVTGNLHKISDKIAEVAKKHEQELSQWKNPPPKSAGSSFTAGEEKSVTEQENTGTLPSSLPAVEEQKEEVDMNVLAVTHTV
ncbi:MAG: hypothetical protein IKA79_05145, partial [Lentisphaeria bacterium]|nr:hypothetical protein [Lentisphaeria bacterium]